MNLRVAIQAGAIIGKARGEGRRTLQITNRRVGTTESTAGAVADCAMAARAHEVHAFFHEAGFIGAVRRVAVQAVLANRLVFPQHRTALIGMAGVAGLVDREFFEQLGTSRTMRVMAIRANHFALTHRVMRVLERFCALLRVAGKALGRLRLANQHGIFRHVQGVAAHASHVGILVLGAEPIHALGVLVAGQTGLVARRNRRGVRAIKNDCRQSRLTSSKACCVRVAWAMAGFTSLLAAWRMRITFHGVRRL